MITASSSIAGSLLTSAFGTSPTNISVPSASTGSTNFTASLLSAVFPDTSQSALLSNEIFGQLTENLLRNPNLNGALTGKPSSYVQQIINALAPNSAASAWANGTPATSTPATFTLPSNGILA